MLWIAISCHRTWSRIPSVPYIIWDYITHFAVKRLCEKGPPYVSTVLAMLSNWYHSNVTLWSLKDRDVLVYKYMLFFYRNIGLSCHHPYVNVGNPITNDMRCRLKQDPVPHGNINCIGWRYLSICRVIVYTRTEAAQPQIICYIIQ